MSINLNLEGLSDEAKTILASADVQKVIQSAIEAAEAPLKRSKDELLGEKKELARQLKEVNDLGGLDALKEVPKVKEEVAKKTTEEQTYADQVKALQKQLTDMRQQDTNAKLQARIHDDIRELKGAPELLESHVKSRIKHEMADDGSLKVTVLDKNGVPMFVDGKEAGIKDLLNEFKGHQTLSRAFDAPQLNGAGSKPSATVAASNPFATATKNLSEQGRLVKTDRARATQLANEAGVKITGLNA